MGWVLGLPLVWAQGAGAAATAGPTALAPLALRRWCGSLTLSPVGTLPSAHGLAAVTAGLTALLVLVLVVQGPLRALSQVFDVPGHLRLFRLTIGRVRRAGRMVATVVGLTVLSWTTGQAVTYNRAEGRDDVVLLTRARAVAEVAGEQGALAALTPLRDLAGLGGNLAFLVVATVVFFRVAADPWTAGANPLPAAYRRQRRTGWINLAWLGCGGLVVYRLITMAAGSPDLPLGGCLTVETLVIPTTVALADGLLFAWLLVELREVGTPIDLTQDEADGVTVRAVVELLPGAILAAVAALPARWLATTLLLSSTYLPSSAAASGLGRWLRWQLSWGLADVQAGALVVVALAGVVAWTRGGLGEAWHNYLRLLRGEGGRLVVVLAAAAGAAGVGTTLVYLVMLNLPASPWLLNAADSYAHYATLPVGLLTLAALVDLGERALPTAELAALEPMAVVAATPQAV